MTPLFPDQALDPANPMLATDSYKHSHAAQLAPDIARMSAYIEARTQWEGIEDIPFFGLQAELAKLAGRVVTEAHVREATPFLRAHGLEAEAEGWMKIARAHEGRLPLRIDALPEGTIAAPGVPLVRVEGTDDDLPWLPGFLETRLLRAVWYPSTIAALSRHVVSGIADARVKTDGTAAGAHFALHDFGARGASSAETAALGGCAHLINAMGTDTVEALVLARNIYGANMAGFSIPASEHSTVTSWGGEAGELPFMQNLLRQFPSGLVACVSDSYDLMRAVRDYWGGALRDEVLARDGVLVVRPDSGDPVVIVPEVAEALWQAFGGETNAQGYRVLHEKVRIIQGDGCDRWSIPRILSALVDKGFSASNVAFGMGGGLLQKVCRDDFGFAMKVSAVRGHAGAWRDVWKDPKTAGGAKTSKKGRVATVRDADGRLCFARADQIDPAQDLLQTVLENGRITRLHRLAEIRARAALPQPGMAWAEA